MGNKSYICHSVEGKCHKIIQWVVWRKSRNSPAGYRKKKKNVKFLCHLCNKETCKLRQCENPGNYLFMREKNSWNLSINSGKIPRKSSIDCIILPPTSFINESQEEKKTHKICHSVEIQQSVVGGKSCKNCHSLEKNREIVQSVVLKYWKIHPSVAGKKSRNLFAVPGLTW